MVFAHGRMALCALALILLASGAALDGAQARAGSRAAFEQAQAAARASYDAAVKQCEPMPLQDLKDRCRLEAEAARVDVVAAAEADFKGTPEAREEATREMAKADYDLARARCAELADAAKAACVAQAGNLFEKVNADAQASRQVTEARRRAAMQKCDALDADAKKACIDDAKSYAK